MGLLARHHMRDRHYRVEGRERVRIVARTAAIASRDIILVVLQRQPHIFRYEHCFGMPRLAQVG